MNRSRHLLSNARGATLIEFALLAPILMVLLLGILAYGQYILTAHTLQQLANDAARAAIVAPSRADRETLARDSVAEGLAGAALARPETVDTRFDEQNGRVLVAVTVDTRDLSLLRVAMVPMPAPILERRAVAELAELP